MLRVWLPMTKDLRNQGLSDVTITNNGATYSTTGGKLGGCYSFDGTNDYINIVCQDFPSIFAGKFSIAFWVYSNDDGTRSVYFGNYGLSGSGYWFNLEKHTANEIRFWWNNGNPDKRFNNTKILISDGWTHFIITKNGGIVKTYLNGQLIETYTNENLSTAIPSTATTFRIGGDYRVTGDLMFNGKMNDFRIYSHALSPMEVKQISQGLVLHYPLDNNGWGQENLLKNSGDLTLWNKESGINCEYDSTVNMYKIYSTTRESSRWGIYQDYAVTVSTDTNYTFSLTGKTDGYSAYLSFGAGAGWPTNYTAFTSNKQRLTKTLTIPAGTTNIRVYLAMYPQTGGGHVYFEKPKLEEGSIATPWCPNSSDELAATMGMNDGIEYDCSGFGNNSTRVGDFSWSSDAPRYNASQYFKDYTSYIYTSMNGIVPTAITMSCWVKSSNKSPRGSYHEPLNISSTNYEFSIYSNGQFRSGYYLGNTRYVKNISGTNLLDGKWHMITSTCDGITFKSYVDAVLVDTTTVNGAFTPMNTLCIGALSSSYGSTELYESDVRIYATALSASDVLSLYQNSAYIDSSGNVYGAVHEEV